ncbi:NUDIX hydrolase [Pseudotabrizicola alkalilacus]|uniref:NUDIX hydrolase n=1 Tax=Pseudotabrizicola alkalilacus TaxID=2305252 RepID=A0A411Z2H1_9RHOB|nr:NUDIX hydrolase [Pseudotabrizicola alkalilacus]RGP37222.1 NUDIX hydrolase [Pseudotabrizicola alkalilacus]
MTAEAPVLDPPVRAAATVILWRAAATGPQVLMGMRGAAAVFMPSKYVFPGGAVDPGDAASPLPMTGICAHRLRAFCGPEAPAPGALAGAAVRELREETGLVIGPTPAPALRFVFRAITPPGRTRRFDARFFLADAAHLTGAPDDFSKADQELSHLHWIGLREARALDLPFITEVVLAEITATLRGAPDQGVPFFDNSGTTPAFRRIV